MSGFIKMRRNKRLEKYIKLYTGCDIKVYIVKCIKGGYGACINSKRLKICEEDSEYKPLIWHEMGHLMAWNNRNWIKNEYKAQEWSLRRLKKLKYNNIYKESIEWIKIWGTRNHTVDDKKYRKVAKMLLK